MFISSIFRKYAAGVIVSLLMISSCSKTKPSYNRENLKGDWVVRVYDGSVVNPDRWKLYSFGEKGSLKVTGIRNLGDGDFEWGSSDLLYEAYCCDVSYGGDIRGFLGISVSAYLERDYNFIESRDTMVTMELVSERLNGEDVYSDFNRVTMTRLSSEYSSTDSLQGIWQTSTRNGEKFEEWRMVFYSDGSFVMMTQSGSGRWTPVSEEDGSYLVYDDFAAVTVFDNGYIGTSGHQDVAMFTDIFAAPSLSRMSMIIDEEDYEFTFVASL